MVLLQSEGTLPVCTHCLSVFSVRVVETPGDGGQPHGVPALPHHAFFFTLSQLRSHSQVPKAAAIETCNVTCCFQNTLDMLQVLSTVTAPQGGLAFSTLKSLIPAGPGAAST